MLFSSTFLFGFSMLNVFMVVFKSGVAICLPLLNRLSWGWGVLAMMEGMLLVTFEGKGIERSERSDRGEEDLGPSSGLMTCLLELAGESGQKCLAVEGVRRGEGRFCDLSESGEARGFMSRHFRDLGVIPLLTISGVTPALSGVRLAVIRTGSTFSEMNLQFTHQDLNLEV